ncbi:beta-glucosidase 12-like isoform X1 [Salvia miltiorrhiza]|uniref:beta-glucosidase 12-like isoform X1 n=1 Tax=Salvia miltiorrhiza TaxID=226208 RepID=UPI0025AB6C7C|nr:beta-glucosidase 12-like isoform X1 [Salvia miltiorrhiza]
MPSLPASLLIIFLLFLVSSSFAGKASTDTPSPRNLSRHSFPPGFIFGAASSAYQYEGAAFEDGRGPSIWDTFTHKYPGKIADRTNGDVANDFYNRYKDDVETLKYIGVDSFRMSISWPRILPRGKLSAGVNKAGIAFYNNVFNELLARGIIPFVTIFHWEVPQALEDEYEGFLSPLIIDDLKDFAELCFKEFGDRIKNWITFNEPSIFITGGYVGDIGILAPGRCSDRAKCAQGNSATEPYIVAHNLLLSHAQIVKLYKQKYQGKQKGEIGITLVSEWFVPYSNSRLDVEASQRALDFNYGWFIDPLVYGDYPKIMRSLVGNRLPKFTKEQKALLKGAFDFLGLNYYTSNYAAHELSRNGNISYTTDSMALLSGSKNGVPIGHPTGSDAFYVYPEGFYEVLVYTKDKYKSPTIYITENGIPDLNNVTIKQSTQDPQRIDFYVQHLQALQKAIRYGVNVKGFFAWTFQDDYEWNSGYTLLFGFYYVDRKNGLQRIPKQSAFWFKNFLSKK